MALFHVHLPQDMMLTVEVTDNPVHFSISFPDGTTVHFDHSGTADPIDVDPALKYEHDTDKMTHTVSSPSSGQVIEYSDPGGSM
jgi:hypothetical protein